MKRTFAIASIGLLGAAIAAVAANRPPDPVPPVARSGTPAPATRPADGRLVVHEWGTFTGFAGSNGVHLPFHTSIGADLPGFVLSRQAQYEAMGKELPLEMLLTSGKGGGIAALQRMETPVVYFYADRPLAVDARVDFSQGLLTEFYPPVRAMGPDYGMAVGEWGRPASPAVPHFIPANNSERGTQLAPSFLDWGRLRIVPNPSGDEGKLVPPVRDVDHYRHARATDAALVQFDDAAGKRHEEKFLFYRGLGNFALPVSLSATGGDRFELNNAGPDAVRAAFLFRSDGSGNAPSHFTRVANLSGRREVALSSGDDAKGDLPSAIVQALVAEGLYEKEAQAMVETWKAGWLGEPGTRVLYIVPRPLTDALLPLRIAPTPDETVRVLVGRIDVMTPEQEKRIQKMMLAVAAAGPAGLTDADVGELNNLRRFLPPALDRAARLRDAATAPAEVTRLSNAHAERRRELAANAAKDAAP